MKRNVECKVDLIPVMTENKELALLYTHTCSIYQLKATNRLFLSQKYRTPAVKKYFFTETIDGKARQGTGKGFPSPKLADAH